MEGIPQNSAIRQLSTKKKDPDVVSPNLFMQDVGWGQAKAVFPGSVPRADQSWL